jgi:hypothetical protein
MSDLPGMVASSNDSDRGVLWDAQVHASRWLHRCCCIYCSPEGILVNDQIFCVADGPAEVIKQRSIQ